MRCRKHGVPNPPPPKPRARRHYGEEVIVDLHGCNPTTFRRRKIRRFLKELCDELGMKRCALHFWDEVDVPIGQRHTEPHLKGTSAVQFITTSNVTIHTLDLLGNVYINVFSCGKVDEPLVRSMARRHFGGRVVQSKKLVRL